ncbi:tetratricopeptide repeat protein, partial [Balneolaceae bacterium ANBcel3]|nr:tetratricopeptide repeat protein [Balneolaceae bacterium ANBcel3]
MIQGCRSGKEITTSDKSEPDIVQLAETPEARSAYIRGLSAMQLEDYEEAERFLMEAYETLYNSAGVNYTLATLYTAQSDYFNAIYYGQKAAELEPENTWYRLLLVHAHRATGNYQEVIYHLDAILETDPGNLDILLLKAQIQHERGDYAGSNKTYESILKRTGSDRAIHYHRINNYSRMDDTDGVIRELNLILEHDQGSINTLLMLAQFYLEQ